MRKRILVFVAALTVASIATASQFMNLPFDRVVRTSSVIVHGTVGPVSSSWNDSHDVIFSRANIEINRYLVGTGPGIIPIREVGGVVDGYAQQAIGFPELREGEEVVLILTRWEDSDEYRIHAYRQGKYLVKKGEAGLRVKFDDFGQGDDRFELAKRADSEGVDYSFDEFEGMVEAALTGAGRTTPFK